MSTRPSFPPRRGRGPPGFHEGQLGDAGRQPPSSDVEFQLVTDTGATESGQDIIVNQLNVNEEQVTPQASFLDDLGADSLDLVELIMAFEEEFKSEIKGEIPESDAEKLTTVGQVMDYIKQKSGAK